MESLVAFPFALLVRTAVSCKIRQLSLGDLWPQLWHSQAIPRRYQSPCQAAATIISFSRAWPWSCWLLLGLRVTGERLCAGLELLYPQPAQGKTAPRNKTYTEVHTNWDPAEAWAMFVAMKTGDQLTPSLTAGGPQDISGLGDEATFAMSALNVREGDAFFSIMLTLPNRFFADMKEGGGKQKFDSALLEMDRTLAQKALLRL